MRVFVERYFELLDRIAVAILGGILFVWGHFADHDATLLAVLAGNRAAIYGTLARLFATVFGFGLTATSIVLAFAKSPRLDVLRRSRQWATLWRVFTNGLGTFLVVTLAGFVGLLWDRDRSPKPMVAYAIAILGVLGAVRLYRLFWAFKSLIVIMIHPERPEEAAPERQAPAVMSLR